MTLLMATQTTPRPGPRIRPSWARSSVMAVVIAIGLLAVGLSMAIYNEDQARAQQLREVTVQADILSGSVAAAVAFDDGKLAEEYLHALAANREVEAAGVYDLTGRLIAAYARPGAAPPVRYAGAPSTSGEHVVVSRPVMQGGTRLGAVYLRTAREPFARRAPRYGGIALLVVMAALFLVVLGVSNASLTRSHRQLKVEMAERGKTEEALRLSREKEAAAQLEIIAQRSQAAIRQSEQQLEFALHAGRLGSWTLDVETGALIASEFVRANFGLGPDDRLDSLEDLHRLTHPDDLEALRRAHDEALQAGAKLETEFRTVSPAGEVRWIMMRGRVVRDEDGPRQMAGVSLDITARMQEQAERQAIENQLRHAQKVEAMGQLTGGVAHDFNNLLAVVVGNLDMLLDAARAQGGPVDLVEDALNAALHGAELTKRLLAFARQQPLETRVIDLNDRLPGMVTMLERTLGEDIQIRTSLAPDLWPAQADPSQVDDALLNLANNARDAMPGGGALIIETGNVALDEGFAAVRHEVAPGDYVMLAVTDTGVGMPQEVIDRATEPFFTTKPEGKGTGLGLSMIYGFAKQSGGHLSIYSEEGVGTTMRLYLPRAASPAPDVGIDAPAEVGGGGEAILVVDDNSDLRRVSVRRLTKLGYKCREAESGPVALAILAEERFDLLFTDIGLPEGMSGYDLAEAAVQLQSHLKVLYTTGYAGSHRRGDKDEQTLRKPYRSDELTEKIRRVLDGPAHDPQVAS